MMFLTVGSALPFDRLVEMIDAAAAAGVIKDTVFAQIGRGRYVPRSFESVPFLARDEYATRFRQSSAVISHAGIGTISSAIRLGKPLLVLPRCPELGELVDDHQLKTARTFEQLGHLLMFTDPASLEQRLAGIDGFVPAPRTANARGVAGAIGSHLADLMRSGAPASHSVNHSR